PPRLPPGRHRLRPPLQNPLLFLRTTTTTTTTYYPFNSHYQNPNPNSFFRGQNPRYLTLIFTTTTSRFPIPRPSLDSVSGKPSDEDSRSSPLMITPSDFPLKFYTAVSSSIRDRSRDIMTVVAALAAMLLGAGCGALTAAAVYFVYVLLSRCRRRGASIDFDDVDSSDDDDADDDVTSAKKFSYLPIPSVPWLVEDDLKKPAPPAKEVV
ncbi:hypothetical protein PHJA_001231600, partial [Phtheirospermum japonicum]